MKPWQLYGMPRPKSEASKGELSLVDYEIYSGIEVPQQPFFVRLDGWKFHGLTEQLKLRQPFDKKFANALAKTAEQLFIFEPCLAYIFSDEINLLFLRPTGFSRVEKIDSILAGLASSTLSLLLKKRCIFDCRVIPLPKEKILSYLIWRQAECFRNYYNAWARAFLIKKEKLSPRAAAKKLEGIKIAGLREILNKYTKKQPPAWQRAGIALYKEEYEKRGYDPIRKKYVMVKRKRIRQDWNLPDFRSKQGQEFLEKLIG